MGKINLGKVLIGGIAGGIVGFILGGVIHMGLFKAASDAMVSSGMCKAATNDVLAMEFVRCALLAILGTYTYALARPRLGASVASAVQVSLLVAVIVALSGWVGMMIWSSMPMAGDMMNLHLIASVIPFVATFVGAWIYKD